MNKREHDQATSRKVRKLPSEGKGREFESRRARHFLMYTTIIVAGVAPATGARIILSYDNAPSGDAIGGDLLEANRPAQVH